MRNALTVLRYTLLRNIRDVPSLIEMIIIPIVMVLVLGSILGGNFEATDIPSTPVAYFGDAGDEGVDSLAAFLSSSAVSNYLEVTPVFSEQRAYELLRTGEVDAAILRNSAEPENITIAKGAVNPTRLQIVRSLLDAYARGGDVARVLGALGHSTPPYTPRSARFERQIVSRDGQVPGAFDFYAVSMLVMFVSYIAQYAAQGVREDFLDPIGARARTTAAPWSAQVAGKLSAHVVSGLLQAAIIIAATGIAFDANWGSRPLLLAALIFALSIFVAALGAFVLSITREGPKSDGILNMIIIASMVLSGGGAPFSATSPGFRAFQEVLPHFQGQRALLAAIYGGHPEAIASALFYFLGGAGLLLIATSVFTRRTL